MLSTPRAVNRLLLFILIGALLWFTQRIMNPFVVPILWSAILTYTVWPLVELARRYFSRTQAAVVVTLVLLVGIGVPVTLTGIAIEQHAASWYTDFQNHVSHGSLSLPNSLARLPVVGDELQNITDQLNSDPTAVISSGGEWLKQYLGKGVVVAHAAAERTIEFVLVVLTVFSLCMNGDLLVGQIRRALEKLAGPVAEIYIQAIGRTTRGVVRGTIATALAQTLLSTLGYAVAGVPGAVLLGLFTGALSMIPFAAPIGWAVGVIYLLATGNTLSAVLLAIWGFVVMFLVDHLLRPMLISGSSHIPFMVVLFGVLGGLAAFGMIGLFVGPVVLAVSLTIWNEWLNHNTSDSFIDAPETVDGPEM